MKVLVINGSPKSKNSNTFLLTRSFLAGAGWLNAEIINSAQADIKGCLGCYACWQKTPGKCVLSDGMETILHKLIAADIVIWSFPLYYFSVPGNLKNLIDRQLPLTLPFMAEENNYGGHPLRYDMTKQRHIVISTCGFWTAAGNYDAVSVLFDRYYGMGNYTAIFCGQGELFRVPELRSRTSEYLEIVRRAGAEYAAGGILKETQEELLQPLYSRDVFEKMADASWNIAQSKNTNPNSKNTTSDDSLNFTTQMAALYRPDGIERVLEFHYTDLEKTYQIVITKSSAEVIASNFKKYSTRIETPLTVWQSIARGEVSGQEALFLRQYKVLGDFDIMLKWDELFGATEVNRPAKKNAQRTNMLILLAPWILMWAAIPINMTVGAVTAILATALLPLFWICFHPVIFERVSIPIIAGLSLAVLLGADARMVVSASYLAFGIMWIIGACTKIPLTAYYSAVNYGNDKAFSNPLFIRTNRILTAAWGILYLITPIWTYALMGTDLSAYTGLINSACPALMGIFTVWFQKWYPARWART